LTTKTKKPPPHLEGRLFATLPAKAILPPMDTDKNFDFKIPNQFILFVFIGVHRCPSGCPPKFQRRRAANGLSFSLAP
ncbi:MAG TPA: hypothetical protein VJ873_03750, partial [bacterium]|nr:hypothetical protein [bacterium]